MDIIFGSISAEQRRADIDKRQRGKRHSPTSNFFLDNFIDTPRYPQNSIVCRKYIYIFLLWWHTNKITWYIWSLCNEPQIARETWKLRERSKKLICLLSMISVQRGNNESGVGAVTIALWLNMPTWPQSPNLVCPRPFWSIWVWCNFCGVFFHFSFTFRVARFTSLQFIPPHIRSAVMACNHINTGSCISAYLGIITVTLPYSPRFSHIPIPILHLSPHIHHVTLHLPYIHPPCTYYQAKSALRQHRRSSNQII